MFYCSLLRLRNCNFMPRHVAGSHILLLYFIDDGVHDEYLCPITREMMREPVMASGMLNECFLSVKSLIFLLIIMIDQK